MASQSLYRKWRSQTFSDLVGQDATVRTLLNAVRDGRLAHAYLFCGPRGTGKTSMARLVAKAVNCANPHDGEPCNECVSCQEITAGRSPDVIEIDAASNTGVDNIRDLRESVNLLGSGGHYRVFVVDEVHMLSTAAFNALLKTLEEPPPHVIFVLATTEAHKVLPTIVSRCQRFNFGRFSMRDLVARLHHIADGEGLTLEPAAADLLARAAQGGMRDAVSLLDQAMAFCGTSIDLERTRAMLGLADPSALRRILEYVAAQQSAEGLHLLNEMVTNGADLRQLNAQLADEWRALVLARAGADVAALMDRSEDEARDITALAQRFSLEELTACARVFARNETPARGLPVPQLALELSFLECLAIKRSGGVPAIGVAPAVQPRESSPTLRPAPSPTPPSMPGERGAPRAQSPARVPEVEELDLAAIANGSASPLPPPPLTAAPAEAVSEAPEERDAGHDALVSRAQAAEAPETDPFADDDVPAPYSSDVFADWLGEAQSKWPLVKQVCKQKSMSVAALLNSARPVLVEPGEVPVLVLQADYQFHLDKLRDPRSRSAIEWALEQVLSTPLRVRMTLGSANGNGHGSGNGNGHSGPNGNGGPHGGPGSGPSAPRSAGGTTNGHAPLSSGEEHGARSSGDDDRSASAPRAYTRAPLSAGGDTPASLLPDALPTEHKRSSGGSEFAANAGKNGNTSADSGRVHDPAARYMPANVTPMRSAAARSAARLEEEVRTDVVIQTLLKNGIELADVRPLDDGD